jgi:hypothetical protein
VAISIDRQTKPKTLPECDSRRCRLGRSTRSSRKSVSSAALWK